MKKFFVGLSGGVDSAVSAALLKERGHDVTGVFIKIWQPEFIECTWREDRLDAMRVAAHLGIPFQEIDLSDEYKREVVDRMTADYARGITPNPDVLCNTSIKFGHFLGWALSEGADGVATGHYARIARQSDTLTLLRGKDANKDQSYFLWQIGQEGLSKTLFPMGEYTKPEVRALAKQYNLPNAKKPDSQGLCFVGDVSMEDFLARFIRLTPGPVVDREGKQLGEHRGAALYTIGQRHGFTGRGSKPYYVVALHLADNTIVVSENREDAAQKECVLSEVRWVGEEPQFPFTAEAEARYRETPVAVQVEKRGKDVHVVFAEPHLIAPGQSLVLYRGEECLGGGTISPWQRASS